MTNSKTIPLRWNLDFVKHINVSLGPQSSRPSSARVAVEQNQHPPGFPPNLSARDPDVFKSIRLSERYTGDTSSAIKVAYSTSWQIANQPIRTLVTSAFALFMAGSSVQFFSIASTLTVLFMHFRCVLGTFDAFAPVRKQLKFGELAPQMIWRIALSVIGIAVGIWKAEQLGFLPTSESDWVGLLPFRRIEESVAYHYVDI
ncbi:unnamed protein product [Agarophyton chilense]